MKVKERTLVIIKPDALQRNLLGEIIHRFERKGLKIVGLKMVQLEDVILDEHYAHHKDKPFFESLKKFTTENNSEIPPIIPNLSASSENGLL